MENNMYNVDCRHNLFTQGVSCLIYLHIFLAFARVGVLGYGGGPSSIPLVQLEVVNNYQWMTVEEFAEVLALGNALPGPIATKMAGYIGYKVAGLIGALVAVAGMIGPTLVAMVILYKFLDLFRDNPYIKGMIVAIKPVVIVLLLQLILDLYPASFINAATFVIAAVAFLAIQIMHIHPALVVVSTLAFGAFYFK
jgi:chromate transporter